MKNAKFSDWNVTLSADRDGVFAKEAAEKLIDDHVSVYVMGHKTLAKVKDAKLSDDGQHIHITLGFSEGDEVAGLMPSHPANEYHSYRKDI